MLSNVQPIHNDLSDHCHLTNYGIKQNTIDALFGNIVDWLEGKKLKWKQTNYLTVFLGPQSRVAAELLFFHYDGPAEREIGSGGERNVCRMYLYDDHCSLNFIGDDADSICGLHFKYSTRWAETDRRLLKFLVVFVNKHLAKVFENEPARFKGADFEVEHLKTLVSIISDVLEGQVIA